MAKTSFFADGQNKNIDTTDFQELVATLEQRSAEVSALNQSAQDRAIEALALVTSAQALAQDTQDYAESVQATTVTYVNGVKAETSAIAAQATVDTNVIKAQTEVFRDTANTYASQASVSAAAALVSKNAAATSATAAATSVTDATTKASEAATSASNALAYRNTALTYQTGAQTAKTAAETAKTASETAAALATTKADLLSAKLASFNEIYLGKYASHPTVDGNGNTLKVGAVYENTVQGKIYQWESDLAWHPYDEESQAASSNAALSASNAAGSATAAGNSATNAANSATTASNSATTANTKAGEASTSASQALVSRNAAGTSETNAAASAASAASSASGKANIASPTFTGIVTAPVQLVNRVANAASGMSYYSATYNMWVDYMGQAGVAGQGTLGTLTPVAGSLVTSWARRSVIENQPGYGWTFESGVNNSGQAAMKAEISAVDGSAKFYGSVTSNASFYGAGTGLTGTAASLTAGRANSLTLITDETYASVEYLTLNRSTGPVYNSAKVHFTPSTGVLYSQGGFSGPGTSLTGTASSLTAGKANLLQFVNGAASGAAFNWSGLGGQPTWLWGGNASDQMYVYNPSNFSVDNAAKLGGVPASETLQKRRAFAGSTGPTLNAVGVGPAEYGFAYAIDGSFSGPFMSFGGINTGNNDYNAQFSLTYQGGNGFRYRTRNGDTATWNEWRELWHSGNMNPPSATASPNTLVQRTANGYIEGTYIHMTDDGNPGGGSGVTSVICKHGDNYYRSTSKGAVKAFLGITGADVYSVRTNTDSYVGVAREMAWKNYGNSHTIFDASQSTSPSGSAINNANSTERWTGTYPTLMGWNGATTYGVRVDSARSSDGTAKLFSEDASYNQNAANPYYMRMNYNGKWRLSVVPGTPEDVSVQHATVADTASSLSSAALATANFWQNSQDFLTFQNSAAAAQMGYLRHRSDNGAAAGFAFLRNGYYGLNMGLDSDNVVRIGGWSGAANMFQMDMGGNLTMLGNVTAYSDERLKTNWRDVGPNFVERWAKVKHGIYDRTDSGERQVGLSAQAVCRVLPDAVAQGGDGILSLNYGAAAAVATVKLAQEVVELKALVLKLMQRLDAK